MSQENVEVTRGGFDAFNRGDLDWISERHHPAIEWTTTSEDPDAGTHRGRDSVRRYFEQWMESFSELRGEIEECFEVSDGRVFAAAHFIGRGRTSGVEMDWRLFLVYTYTDGTVLRAEEYFDRNEALEALGLSE